MFNCRTLTSISFIVKATRSRFDCRYLHVPVFLGRVRGGEMDWMGFDYWDEIACETLDINHWHS